MNKFPFIVSAWTNVARLPALAVIGDLVASGIGAVGSAAAGIGASGAASLLGGVASAGAGLYGGLQAAKAGKAESDAINAQTAAIPSAPPPAAPPIQSPTGSSSSLKGNAGQPSFLAAAATPQSQNTSGQASLLGQ